MGSKKTTTQEMPAFQQEFLEGTVIPFAEDFLATEYQPYTGERVAGMTPLQQQAMAGYGGLDMGSPLYGQAAATYGDLAGFRAPEATAAEVGDVGALATTDYGQYMSPYTEAVIESGLRDLGGAQDVSLMQQAAKAQKAKAFGGSRHGIAEAETRKTYGQQAADLVARERARAFEQAQRAAEFDITGEQQRAIQDASFQQQSSLADQQAALDAARVRGMGAAGLGSVAGQQLQSSLAGLGAQTAAGESQRALGQAGLDAQFQDFMAQQNYPLTQFGVLTGAAGAIPEGYGTTTQRTSGLGPVMSAAGSLAMGFPNSFFNPFNPNPLGFFR
ncbi:MAG: hypothetical protein CMJ25_07300 [Phycisphaerae bacterium]|nr:hypothetical protein [Phycisphaerae bacterium]|tara:strand:- start:639 stop:1628 length:990 start_codon:yes stop_codon:yes gene_type:complete